MYLLLWRELYHALDKVMCAVLRHCSRRGNGFAKRDSIVQVFRQLYLSDDDCFDDNDSDGDSDKELNSVDHVSDFDSEATEDYSAQTADDLNTDTAHVDW